MPGVDDRLAGEAAHELLDRGFERGPIAAGQIDAADRALEEHVAGEQRPARRVGQVAGAVAGRVEHLDVHPGEVQPLAPAQLVVGLVVLERAEARRDPAHHVREQRQLDLRAVHGSAGGARQGGDGADVVEVAVGEQDRLDLDAEGLRGLEQALRLVARVYDHRPARLRVGPDDVAVLLHRADRVGADVGRAHRVWALPSRAFLRWRRS